MKTKIQTLIDLILEDGLEVVRIADFGITLDNEPVDYVMVMEHWETREQSISFISGEPNNKYALYWNSNDCEENAEFAAAVDKCIENME